MLGKEMKKISQTLLLLIIMSSPASSFDAERDTGGSQFIITSGHWNVYQN